MTEPVIAWSHSRNQTFKQCAKKFFHLNVAKDIPFVESPEMKWGKDVHRGLERRLMVGADLPANMEQYEAAALKVEHLAKRINGEILCEQQMAVDSKLNPCMWFGAQTWGRCINDVLVIGRGEHADKAFAVDWKTGKKKSDDVQLALQAAFTFRHYPEVNTVLSAFCWLKESNEMEFVKFSRENEPRLWKQALPIVRQMTDAVNLGDWPARPTGLCGWCPVTTCKHWKKRG